MPIQRLAYKIAEACKMTGLSEPTVRKGILELGIQPARVATDKTTRALLSIDDVLKIARLKGKKRVNLRRPLVISVYAPKGGIGKSTMSRELAGEFSLQGYDVMAIDLDDQASLSLMFGYEPDEDMPEVDAGSEWLVNGTFLNLVFSAEPFNRLAKLEEVVKQPFGECGPWLIPADITLGELSYKLWNATAREQVIRNWINKGAKRRDDLPFDIVLIDNAPATSIVSRTAMVAADILLVPVKMDKLTLKSITFLAHQLTDLHENQLPAPSVVAVPNSFKSHSSRAGRVLARLQRDFGAEVPIAPYVRATDKINDSLGDPRLSEEPAGEDVLPIVFQHRNRNYERLQEEIRAVASFILDVAARLPQRQTGQPTNKAAA